MYMVRRGIGAVSDLPTPLGKPYDCTNWIAWTVNPQCWGYSPSAWSEIVAFQSPPAATTAEGTITALTGGGATPPTPEQQQEASNADILASQAQLQSFFQTQPTVCEGGITPNVDGTCPTTLSWEVWAVIAVAVGAVALMAVRR